MVTIINFSSRKKGNSFHIARVCSELYQESTVYNWFEGDYHKCENCDYECLQKKPCPIKDNLEQIYQSLFESELVIYVVPNYNEFPCSNYFIFNERLRGYLSANESLYKIYMKTPKKFIVLTNTQNDNFENAFKYHVDKHTSPNVLYMSSKKFKQASVSAELMENQDARNIVVDFILDKYIVEESAMAIVFHQSRLLVTNEEIYGRPVISLPKGHVEANESIIETAMRECYEETGVKLTKKHCVGELEPFKIRFINHYNKLINKIIHPVIFELDNYVKPYSKEKRIKEAKYVEVFEFFDCATYDNVKEIVKNAMLKRVK